jgi:hypothetical protein
MMKAKFLASLMLGLSQTLALVAGGRLLNSAFPLCTGSAASPRTQQSSAEQSFSVTGSHRQFVLSQDGDRQSLSYRRPTQEESERLFQDAKLEGLHTISSPRPESPATGLQITLQGTAELDNFPQAKAALLNAAAHWEALIQTPITVLINVDFGPTVFGDPFPPGVIGGGNTQLVSGTYDEFRNGLIKTAGDDQKRALYNALPSASIPTDVGALSTVLTCSANARAVGLLPPVPDPQGEMPTIGPPPAFALNSAVPFDFDPTNGIDAGKYDFDAVATNLIGQTLGFFSNAGDLELNSKDTPALSVLDFFRFRPGATLAGFTTTPRVQHSGGDQVFFHGSPEIPFSTGRPDGSGGDGRPSSAWKDEALTGIYLGVFHPNAYFGQRHPITLNDLSALDAIGYTIKPSGAPVVTQLSASLNGDVLSISGAASDSGGPFSLGVITQAQAQILDGSGGVLMTPPVQAINSGRAAAFNFSLTIAGLDQLPTAIKVSVVALDTTSAQSSAVVADFSQADAGGPQIRRATFDGVGTLLIKGSDFSNPTQLEVNGVVVAPPAFLKVKPSGAKVVVSAGSASDLNLRSGANRLRCISAALRSNIFVLTN